MGKKGSVAVEACLVFPILIVLVFGITEYGLYFLRSYGTEQITFEAARTGGITDGESDVKKNAAELKAAELIVKYGLSDRGYTVTVNVSDDYTTVTLYSPYNSLTGLMPLPVSIGSTFEYLNY
jgi:Flp pilus assembly protein TadG